jgi:hypothetical protein
LGQARGVKLGGPELAEAREAAAASIKALAGRHVTKGMTAIKKMSLPFARELAAKAHPPDFKNSVKARRCCFNPLNPVLSDKDTPTNIPIPFWGFANQFA